MYGLIFVLDLMLRNHYLVIFVTLLMHTRHCVDVDGYMNDNAVRRCTTKSKDVMKKVCVGPLCFETKVTLYYLECQSSILVGKKVFMF